MATVDDDSGDLWLDDEHGLLLPGWHCNACETFNGEAKEKLLFCRFCDMCHVCDGSGNESVKETGYTLIVCRACKGSGERS